MAITVIIQPDPTLGFDSYIHSAYGDNNYGAEVSFEIGYHTNGLGGVRRSLIKIDLLKYISKKSLIVDDATLSIYCGGKTGYSTVGVYEVLRDWVETEVTWNNWKAGNAWTTAGCAGSGDGQFIISSYAAVTQGAWSNIVIPNGWLQRILKGTGFGVRLNNDHEEATNFSWFYSSDYTTDPTLRPKITLTYEPYHKIYMVKSGLGYVK